MSALTPYLCVNDSRAAIEWYGKVFQATVQYKPYVMDDGRIGHVELKIGDALLMMADSFPEVNVEPPDPSHGSAVSLHLEVADCDTVPTWTVAPNRRATADRPHSAIHLATVGC